MREENLIKVDRNGTQHIEVTETCPKCGGSGYLKYYWQYADGICFECKGTGHKHYTKKIYTPEYEKKLEERKLRKRLSKLDETNAEVLRRLGFNEEGRKYAVLGNTYEIKEELKAKGARFDKDFHWCFKEKMEGYRLYEIDAEKVLHKNDLGEYTGFEYPITNDIAKMIRESTR